MMPRICPHCGKDTNAPPALELSLEPILPPDLGFGEWWAKYPRKVGKLAAEQRYRIVVMQKTATAAQLMDGLRNYLIYKPEKQPWCHPVTWLNQGRWMDKDTEQVEDERREATWQRRDAIDARREAERVASKRLEAESDPPLERRRALADKLKGLADKIGRG